VAPPENQAANGENKLQPVAMGGPGLLDYTFAKFIGNNLLDNQTMLDWKFFFLLDKRRGYRENI